MFEGEDVVKGMKAQQAAAENQRKERMIAKLGEFLTLESGGDESHPAEAARKALETGSTREAVAYLSAEIDKAKAEGNEGRRGELMRWKTSLS